MPVMLAAGESFTFHVTFTPQRSGVACGGISIVSGAPEQTLTIQLAGIGRASRQLRMEPAVIAFGDVDAGTQSTQIGHLTAITARQETHAFKQRRITHVGEQLGVFLFVRLARMLIQSH